MQNAEGRRQNTLDLLIAEHDNLKEVVQGMNDTDLDMIIKGREYSAYVLLHGVIQHNLYHAGQISFIYTALKE